MARRNLLWFTLEGKVLYLDVLFMQTSQKITFQVCVTSIEFQLFCLWKATGSDYFLSHRRLHRVSIGCRLLSILLFLYGLCVYILRVQHNPLNHSKNMWPPSETFFLSLSLKERKKVKICDSRAREASLVYSSCFIFWWKVNWFLETQFVLTHSRTRQVAKCKFSFCRDSVQKSPTS
jgi:hypothetical protein